MVKDLHFQEIVKKTGNVGFSTLGHPKILWRLTLGFQPFRGSMTDTKFLQVCGETKQEAIQEMIDSFGFDLSKLKDYV